MASEEGKRDIAEERIQESQAKRFNTNSFGSGFRNAILGRNTQPKPVVKKDNPQQQQQSGETTNTTSAPSSSPVTASPASPVTAPPGDSVTPSKLKKTLQNASNYLNRIRGQGKKKKKEEEKEKEKEKEDESNDENKSEENDGNTEKENTLETEVRKRWKRFKIKVLLYAGSVSFILIFFVAFFFTLFGVNIAEAVPALGPNTYNTPNYQPTYEEGTKERVEEEKYLKKLDTVSKDYAKEHGEEIKQNYIHSVLIYKTYQTGMYETSNNEEDYKIDYNDFSKKIDDVTKLIEPSDSKKNISYERNGEFYNNLVESDFIKDYYKELIDAKSKENSNKSTKEAVVEVVDEIFDFAKEIENFEYEDETVVTSETKVTVTPDIGTKTDNSNKTQNNNNSNKNTKTETKTETMSYDDYLLSSVYTNVSDLSNTEMIKAYTIVSSTNMVASNKELSITSNNAVVTDSICSIKTGCSYDKNGKLINGPGLRSDKNTVYYNGAYFYRAPLSSKDQEDLSKTIKSVSGTVLVNSNGTYPSLNPTVISNANDTKDYKTILKAYGDSLKYREIGEDSYSSNDGFGSKTVLTKVIFYDQKDYSNSKFCGIKGYTIGGSGCGVTSMAIIASTYEKSTKYNPVYMNNMATSGFSSKMCGGGKTGTLLSFFGNMAKKLNYKYRSGGKTSQTTINLVKQHLAQGHLVIAKMGSGTFTNGGHYVVLGGINPKDKTVYVYDPNNRSNSGWRKTGNGWYSFSRVIVKEAHNFVIIWKG